jgi:hypothetical protein
VGNDHILINKKFLAKLIKSYQTFKFPYAILIW